MNLIVRVTSSDPTRSLDRLITMPIGLDVWQVTADHVVARASDAQAERLRQMGYGVAQVHQTHQFLATFLTAAAGPGFHSAATVESGLRQLATAHPEIAELREMGRSVENRPIWVLRLGERRPHAPKVLFMGCHHAREWLSVEVPYRLAESLVQGANAAPVKDWLSRGEIWIAPMVNPDGHEFSRGTQTPEQRLWRKNRRPNADGSVGVDPNRNYGYMWGVLDVSTSSHVPHDDTYVGPHAFSEPETQAVRDLVAVERFRGLLTYHSFSQLILHPWGYTSRPIANVTRRQELVSLGEKMADLIKGVHGKAYTPEQSSQLYPTAGDTTDWAYGTYHIPAFTIELRPASVEEGGFIVPASEIEPTWEEQWPAASEFIRHTLAV